MALHRADRLARRRRSPNGPLEDSVYDLSTDPAEEQDLAHDRPFVASALRQLLAWEEHRLAGVAPAAPVQSERGAEEREHLKQLGYLE